MSATIKDRLEREARDLGFDLFGVAPARPAATGEFFSRWLQAGRQGEMDYLARGEARRRDPREVLPGARSIICVGMSYRQEEAEVQASGAAPGRGRVARYARGRDYHRVMGSRLRSLGRRLSEECGGSARWYVDTGPVLEREYAARAGLGWFGKHTNLMREDLGSYLLLGEIITDLAMPADDPVADRCGTCTACIDACPTEAILEPYLLDSNRCISYLTIEHRGAIPRDLRPGVGDWMFGCDVCQEVCPWNRDAPETAVADLRPRPGSSRLDPVEVLGMSEEKWRERFRGSAVKRATWRGLRRNAAVVLGNLADPAAVPALAGALRDPDPLVRRHAAWALGRLRGPAARSALREAAARERDGGAGEEMRRALEEIDGAAPGPPPEESP